MSNDNHTLGMALSSRTEALTFSDGFLYEKLQAQLPTEMR